MNCQNCGYDNPEGTIYCEHCADKIDYSRERIQSELAEKADRQAEERLEEQTRDLLVLTVAVFLFLVTVRMMFGTDDWPRPDLHPSSTRGSPQSVLEYRLSPDDVVPEDHRIRELPLPENSD